MTYRNSKGQEFDTLDEMMAEYRRNRTRGQRVYGFVRGRWSRVIDPVVRLPRRIRWAHQRVARGWDDTTVWRLDGWLAKTLGAQLVRMAETVHGYPSHYPYEQWTADMRKHGEALQVYARSDFLTSPKRWEEVDHLAAQEALRWVADHLAYLWD